MNYNPGSSINGGICYSGFINQKDVFDVTNYKPCTEFSQILMINKDHDVKWDSAQNWHQFVLGIKKAAN